MTRAPSLPPVAVLAAADAGLHDHVLTLLFERSDALADLVTPELQGRSFSSYEEYIKVVEIQLLDLLRGKNAQPLLEQLRLLDSILQAHPRLGASKAVSHEPAKLSAASSMEQRSLVTSESDSDTRGLQKLNEEYERVFPSLRYL